MNPPPTTDTQRLRELLTAATPGPWSTHDMEGSNNTRLFYVGYYIGSIGNSDAPKVQNEMDAALIATLRNGAPALLDEIEGLRIDRRNLIEEMERRDVVQEDRIRELLAERDSLRRENEELKSKLR